jgi:hypothetical protein
MSTTAATEPLEHHWEKIAFYLRHALSLFGDPAKLAQQLWISARDHKLFRQYIRPLEDAVRRLIFIAALELTPMTLPPTPERKYRARHGMKANGGATFEITQPETWRVSFKLAPAPMDRRRPAGILASPSKNAGKDAGGPYRPSRISAAPCAERLEALLRAYENRDKRAAALARKIARNARIALDHVTRRRLKQKGPVYVWLPEIAPLTSEAHQHFIHKRLDALLPARTDSS